MSAEELERQQRGAGSRRLGDLTEPIKRERGELEQYRTSEATRGVPPDVASQNRLAQQFLQNPGQALSPAVNTGAYPSYDTLPANAVNCTFTNKLQLAGVALTDAIVLTKVVPAGRVVYIREVRVNMTDAYNISSSPNPIGIPNDIFYITLFVNGNADIFNQRVASEPLDNYYPMWAIAGPGDVITVSVSYDFSTNPTPPTHVDFIATARGDVLLPNIMPVPYTALLKGQ